MEIGEKIADNVALVGSDRLSGTGDCDVYAIQYAVGKVCLIDAGVSSFKRIYENICQVFKEKGKNKPEITHLFLTHCHIDHIGAAHQVQEMFPHLTIIAHAWDTAAIEGRPGTEKMTAASWYGVNYQPIKITCSINTDNLEIKLDDVVLTILHTPGHTPGSISIVYNHPKIGKILFGQDVHGPFMSEFNSNVEDWQRSMKLLLAQEPDILCEGHYGIIKGRDSVRKFIESQLHQH
ncbi:MAG: Zn-dependent hydrolase [Promethearchaeia archaeon]|nr:MAG: Zn-dependent hydrolase [Candidatus Lokiarchaeia archaeon]